MCEVTAYLVQHRVTFVHSHFGFHDGKWPSCLYGIGIFFASGQEGLIADFCATIGVMKLELLDTIAVDVDLTLAVGRHDRAFMRHQNLRRHRVLCLR